MPDENQDVTDAIDASVTYSINKDIINFLNEFEAKQKAKKPIKLKDEDIKLVTLGNLREFLANPEWEDKLILSDDGYGLTIPLSNYSVQHCILEETDEGLENTSTVKELLRLIDEELASDRSRTIAYLRLKRKASENLEVETFYRIVNVVEEESFFVVQLDYENLMRQT